MAAKPEVTAAFARKVREEAPKPDEDPKAYLNWALPLYRGIQSAVENGQAQMAYLAPDIAVALRKIEQQGGAPEYVARAGRTMGMLAPCPKPIDKKRARSQAAKIRRAVARVLGSEAGRRAVQFERKVTVKVDWDLVAKGGKELLNVVRAITGLRKPRLIVGKKTKRVSTGKERKRRG